MKIVNFEKCHHGHSFIVRFLSDQFVTLKLRASKAGPDPKLVLFYSFVKVFINIREYVN